MRTLALALIALSAIAAAEPVTGSVELPAGAGAAVRFTLPEGWSAVVAGPKLVLLPPQRTPHIQVWSVAQPSLDAAVAALPATVADEVKQFAATASEDLTLAGAAAKHVTATGVEADDGDEATAECFVFSVAGHTLVACAHGEGDGPAKRRDELAAVLGTATAR